MVVAVMKTNTLDAEVSTAACRALWQLAEHPDSLLSAAKHGAGGARDGAPPSAASGRKQSSSRVLWRRVLWCGVMTSFFSLSRPPARAPGGLDCVLQVMKVHANNQTVISTACRALRVLADDPQLQASQGNKKRKQNVTSARRRTESSLLWLVSLTHRHRRRRHPPAARRTGASRGTDVSESPCPFVFPFSTLSAGPRGAPRRPEADPRVCSDVSRQRAHG